MTGVTEKILALHASLEMAELPHAFGGALALAWCTRRAGGTIDIDVNVFLGIDDQDRVLAAFPQGVRVTASDRKILRRDGQVRVWWEQTPIDLFLNTTDYHLQVATRVRWETFAGREIPFLACTDLAVFKVFFNRTKDWADLEEMQAAGTLDIEDVASIIASHLGVDDERLTMLRQLPQR